MLPPVRQYQLCLQLLDQGSAFLYPNAYFFNFRATYFVTIMMCLKMFTFSSPHVSSPLIFTFLTIDFLPDEEGRRFLFHT